MGWVSSKISGLPQLNNLTNIKIYKGHFGNLFNKTNTYYENRLKIKLMFFENAIFNFP